MISRQGTATLLHQMVDFHRKSQIFSALHAAGGLQFRGRGDSLPAPQRGEVVRQLGATIVHPPEEGAYAPGYYSLLFEDPDGIRLEINFVPGKGLLE